MFTLLPRRIRPWLAVLAASLIPMTAMAERVLRYSDHEPLGGMRTKFLQERFFAAIEKESQGRLRIAPHWNGQLAGAYDALRAAGRGEVTDLAMVVPEYTAKELPLHQLFKSFPVGPSGQQQVSFFRQAYADIPELSGELAQNQVEPVFLATGYPVAFFSTAPLRTPADMRGQRWRTASFWHRDFLNQTGAVPVSMPWGPQVYDALEKRTLDGLMVNVDSGHALNVHRTAPHVLLSPDLWLGHLYLVVMNRDTWNGLAPEGQQAIWRAADTAYRSLGAVMDTELAAMEATLKKEGATVRRLEAAEVSAWQTATRYASVQANWAKAQEGQGVASAGSVLGRLNELMKKTAP